ncbi:MAG: hypothetical protein HDT14_03165 [Oscillibacter sp.]|nr:hypothetical protein [Oscillibacter sp.]
MDNKLNYSNNSGVLWGKYNREYAKYEIKFPEAFPWPQPAKEDEPRYIKGDDGYWYNPAATENGKAVLSCTGDIMCEPMQHRAYKYGDHYYFHPQFKYVRNLFKQSDLVVGNLETTLTDATPYADQLHKLEGGGYHCNAPAIYLDAIRYAGFDALVNANNHSCDSAVIGLLDTLDAMDEKRFMHTGTFHPEGDERILYVKVNGIKLAILSYATYFNKNETNFTQLGRDTLLNAYTPEKVTTDIAAAKNNGAEFVLVYMHWGKEYTHEVSELQKKRANEIANAGADYIVGSHPHALQHYDVIITNNGQRVPVVYSMGNFVTNERRIISKHCGVLQIILQKTNVNVVVKNDYFIPCYVFNQIRTSKYAVVPTDIALSDGVWYKSQPEAETYIQKVMGDVPTLKATSITVEEVCSILNVKRPEQILNRPFSKLCSRPSSAVDGCLFFSFYFNSDSDLQNAYRNGAHALITDREITGLPCIVVEDVCEAFCKVFSYIRRRFTVQTIAVTGNAGKTTTKETLEKVLNDQFITLASPGNWNTRYTSMMVMQRLRSYHEAYLQEVHEGDPRSAEMISRAILPNYAIITNMGIAHRENFGSDEAIIQGYTDITAGMSPDGILYINGDDEALMEAVRKNVGEKCRVKTFGMNAQKLDFRIENLTSDGVKIDFDVSYEGKKAHIVFPSPVRINAYSAVAAFAVGVDMGIDAHQVIKSIAKYKSNGIRQHFIEYEGLKMFLDCRSATPVSMRSSIESFCSIPIDEGAKRVAVIGEMHIVENSKEEHQKIGEMITGTNIDYLFCYGAQAEHTYNAAIRAGFNKTNAAYFSTKRELEIKLCSLLQPGDALLIKGGRRMYLNSTIRKLFGLYYAID